MVVKIYYTKNVVRENIWFGYRGRTKKIKCGQCNKMFTMSRKVGRSYEWRKYYMILIQVWTIVLIPLARNVLLIMTLIPQTIWSIQSNKRLCVISKLYPRWQIIKLSKRGTKIKILSKTTCQTLPKLTRYSLTCRLECQDQQKICW